MWVCFYALHETLWIYGILYNWQPPRPLDEESIIQGAAELTDLPSPINNDDDLDSEDDTPVPPRNSMDYLIIPPRNSRASSIEETSMTSSTNSTILTPPSASASASDSRSPSPSRILNRVERMSILEALSKRVRMLQELLVAEARS